MASHHFTLQLPRAASKFYAGWLNMHQREFADSLRNAVIACYITCLNSAVNRRAENGATPVYFAAQEGQLNCMQFLISQVSNEEQDTSPKLTNRTIDISQVEANCRMRASDGMAPVHAAAQMGQLDCLAWLV